MSGSGDFSCNTVVEAGMSAAVAPFRSVPVLPVANEDSRAPDAAQALAVVQGFVENHRMRWKEMPGGFAAFERDLHERVQAFERGLIAEAMARVDIDAEAITGDMDMDKTSFDMMLAGNDTRASCEALTEMAFDLQTDRAWFEQRCAEILRSHPEAHVRSLAATCLGHTARITRTLSEGTLALLRSRVDDASLEGAVANALEDWWMFVGRYK